MTFIYNKTSEKIKRMLLRNNMPKAEIILWSKLKNKQLNGYKFRRQHGIGKFVVDFYSPELKLVIEVDGDSHFVNSEAQEYDKEREVFIQSLGIKFLRFLNTEIYENLDGVLEKISNDHPKPLLSKEGIKGRLGGVGRGGEKKASALFGDKVGQTLVELLLALGLFAFIMTAVFALVFGGLTTGLRTEEQDYATMYAQEGLDAARSIRDTDWNAFAQNGTHGVANSGSGWSWSGTNNETAYGVRKYTREITVENVYRTASNDIFTGSSSANFDYTNSADYQCEGGSCPSTNIIFNPVSGTAKLRGTVRLDNSVNPKELTADPTYTKALYHFNATSGAEANKEGKELALGDLGGVADTNLKGLWHLNENTGQTTADIKGINTGTRGTTSSAEASDPTWTTAGKFSNALSFDGGDYVNAGTNSVLDFTSGDLTFESWIYPNNVTGWKAILGKYNGTTGGYIFALNGGQPAFWRNGVWYYGTASSVVATQWQHIAVKLASGTLTFYVNGVAQTPVAAGSPLISTAQFQIGAGGSNWSPFNGFIDEVAVYNTALTPAQITDHYNRGIAADAEGKGSNTGTLLSSGAFGYTTVGTLIDSGNQNVLSATRFTMPASGGTMTSISAYVTNVGSSPNNQYQLGIYSDTTSGCGGPANCPGSLIANTGSATITNNAWNTIPLSTTLSANTSYWLAYNTNGATNSNNNLKYDAGAANQYCWSSVAGSVPFGTWPSSAGAVACSADQESIYATYVGDTLPAWTTAKLGASALSFDGVDDYVSLGNPTAFQFGKADSFTLEGWIKPSSTASYYSIISKERWASPYEGYSLETSGQQLWFDAWANGSNGIRVQTGNVLTVDNWYHVAVTYSGTGTAAGVKIYLNGVQQSTTATYDTLSTFNFTNTAMNAEIGGRDGANGAGYGFPGTIDEVAIYNTALSQDEIRRQCGWDTITCASPIQLTGKESGLVALYHLNDGGSSTTAADSKGDHGAILGPTSTSSQTGLGQALTFDGVNDYVSVADTVDLSPTSQLTAEAWVNQSALAVDKTIISKWAYSTQGTWAFQTDSSDNSRLKVFIANSLTDAGVNYAITPAGSWSTGWHHVAFTYDGAGATYADKLKVYIDGVSKTLAFIGTIPSALQDSTAMIRIGDLENLNRFWNGSLDEVAIWNKALSQQDIWDHIGANLGYAVNSNATVKYNPNPPGTPNKDTLYIDRFKEFVETATIPAGTSIDYQMSTDNCATMKYWDGDSWEATGGWNDVRTINRYFDQFKPLSSTICLSARLNTTDQTQTPILDNVEIKYSQSQGGAKLNNPAGINAVQTTGITLSSVIGLPTSGSVTIDNEVITYTALSGNDLSGTVTRGANGTTAFLHLLNAEVKFTLVDPHTKRITSRVKWPSGFSFQDVSLTEYLTDWMYSEFKYDADADFGAAGSSYSGLTIDGTDPDTVYISNPITAAQIYTSPQVNTNSSSQFMRADWAATVPAGTSLSLQVRSAPDNSGAPGTWSNWCGSTACDNTSSYALTDGSGNVSLTLIPNNQWIQYGITFTPNAGNTQTPILDKITIQAKNLY